MSEIGHEYKDNIKQGVAICYRKWADKKAKASYVVATAEDEYISDEAST